ncbi:MAG: hypothetical protein JNL05_09680 [Flavobacteriales bacterium]|nr:hypothetical protein [Flavobacteriales bacterium]
MEYLDVYVVAPNTLSNMAWRVHQPVLTNDSLKGRFERMNDVEAWTLVGAEKHRELREQQNSALLYLRDTLDSSADIQGPGLPMSAFSRIEVIDADVGASIGFFLLAVVGIAAVVAIIIALTKESCPFIYAYNEEGCHFEGEVFSGAVSPQLQRHDRLPLPHLGPVDGRYRVRVANKAREIQRTDLAELLVVDHPEGSMVLFDRDGSARTISAPVEPSGATDQSGRDAMALIASADDRAWQGDPTNDRPNADEYLDVSFPRPQGVASGRLVITARNTFWADQLYGMFLDEFGSKADALRERMQKRTAEEMRQWAREQYLPLSVSMKVGPDRWERIGQFELAGPMAWRQDVLEIDLSRATGERIELRLGSGFMFWQIDAVAFDTSTQIPVAIQRLQPDSAIDQAGRDVRASMLFEDGDLLVQPAVGDAVELSFRCPAPLAGMHRSLFLHAAGHYEILREPRSHEPDMRYLRGFKEPGALSRYSRERWNELGSLTVERAL